MIGLLSCYAVLALQPSEPPTIRLSVLAGDKQLGTAQSIQRLLSDGSKQVSVILTLQATGEKSVKVRQESIYGTNGAPVRQLQEVIGADGKRAELTVVTFDKSGALVSRTADGKRQERLVPLVSNAPSSNPSQFWFLRDAPKKGATATYFRFDLASMRWLLTETKYEGDVKLSIGGKTVVGRELRSDYGTTWVDARGDPLKVETPKLRMIRLEG